MSEGIVGASDSGGSVHVVGTAHVSQESADEVERVVEERDPDVVAVELDESRFKQLKGETPDDIDARDLLHGSVAFQFLAYWLLSYVQARLGDRFDVEPGADMRAGVDTAERIGADVALIDRDIQITIQRFWAQMRLREKLRLVWELILAVAGIGGTSADEEIHVDELTDADVVTAMLEEFRRFSPRGAAALIDERDAYLAHNLVSLREAGADVVAVVGHRAVAVVVGGGVPTRRRGVHGVDGGAVAHPDLTGGLDDGTVGVGVLEHFDASRRAHSPAPVDVAGDGVAGAGVEVAS
ncbi:MAG: TraB family protein, partial [Halanaeroarchaeum sp.]